MKAIVEFYNKLSVQERKIFYGALAMFTIMCMDYLFFQPVTFKLKTLDKEIEQTKSDIKRDVRYLSYQNKIMKEDELYHSFQPDEKKADGEILGAFMKSLEDLASSSSINLGKRSPGESVQKKGYTLYSANIECTGKLENVVTLIHKINTTNTLLKVVKMSMAGKKSSADEVTVSMKVIKLVLDLHTPEEGEATKNDKQIIKNAEKILQGIPVEFDTPENDAVRTPSESLSGGTGGTAGGPAAGENSGTGVESPSGDGAQSDNAGGGSGTGNGSRGGGTGASPSSGQANGSGGNSTNAGEAAAGADDAGQAGATGSASGGVAGAQTKRGKNAKSTKATQSTKAPDKTKTKKSLTDQFNTGERLTAKKSLGDWWHDFWGGGKEADKPNEKDEEPQEPDKQNFMQKLLQKGQENAVEQILDEE